MSFTLDYCCEQIEKHQDEVLVDQLRRLASESEGRFGSRGNTARLLRVVAARLERDASGVAAELRERSDEESKLGRFAQDGRECAYDEAADLVTEQLAGEK